MAPEVKAATCATTVISVEVWAEADSIKVQDMVVPRLITTWVAPVVTVET